MNNPIKYEIVKAAVDRADPCGLLEIDAPSDEYELEATRIADVVSVGYTEERIAKVAAEVFSKAFACELSAERFCSFAQEVWNELKKSGLI